MNYRKLTNDEIARLQAQSCLADDWERVSVAEGFTTDYVHHTRFSGEVRLGVFQGEFTLPGGIKKHASLRHVTLHNVSVGNNCCIENIQNYIANYEIGDDTFIENVDRILVDGTSTFGNGVEAAVLNETGGREVAINDKLSAHIAYIMALYRHRPVLTARLKEITDFYARKHASDRGRIGCHVTILNTGSIKNVRIGDHCRISGAGRLYNGSINSNEAAPVHIGQGVVCEDFIISSGSHVDDGAMLTMYKLGPIHQGTLERGAKTSSDSYILWPARVGAFSLVMGRHVNHADTSNLPFSYLIEQQNTTYLAPGVNLRSVGTIRDAQKWPKRDGRTDPHQLDYINYNLLSPYTVQKMFKGRDILLSLRRASGELSDIYSYHSAKIRNSALMKGIGFYETAIHKFLGNSVIKRLEETHFRTDQEIRDRLRPDTPVGSGEWVDISGLIAPKSEVDRLLDAIEQGDINRLEDINLAFGEMHRQYYTYEWTWAYDRLEEFYGVRPEEMTAADIIRIVEQWKEAVVGLDRMLYEDARKEFSLASMTGFGADGSRLEKELDFEQVRGDFESNPFVTAVLEHIKVKTALGDELIERMKQVNR